MVRVVGEVGAVGAAAGGGLQQRHAWFLEYNEVISSARKCLLLWQISILGGAFEQERVGKEEKLKRRNGGGGGFLEV